MKANIRMPGLGAMLIAATISAAHAQDRSVALAPGAASRLFLDRAFETVIIGDPLVVDIRIDDDRSAVIQSLHSGITNIVFVDARGIAIANFRISVCGASTPGVCEDASAGL